MENVEPLEILIGRIYMQGLSSLRFMDPRQVRKTIVDINVQAGLVNLIITELLEV